MTEDREKCRLYGQIIENFANAQTISEASLVLFKGIQKAFDFSPKFVDHAKMLFTVSGLLSAEGLSNPEKVLLKLILTEKRIKDRLNEQFQLISRNLEDYDCQKQTLSFREFYYSGGVIKGEFDVFKSDSKLFEEHINDVEDDIWNSLKPWTLNKAKKLMMVGNRILKLKNSISESRFSEIERLSLHYKQLLKGNGQMAKTRRELRHLLGTIVNGQNLYGYKIIDDFVNEYNRRLLLAHPFWVEVNENGTIIERRMSLEQAYLYISQDIKTGYYQLIAWPGFYREAIIHFVINFLKSDKNRKLIHKCEWCGKYFVSNKVDKRIRFCPICSPKSKMTKEQQREYQRELRNRKKKQREAEEAARKDIEIKSYMKSLNLSREEAIELWEEEHM